MRLLTIALFALTLAFPVFATEPDPGEIQAASTDAEPIRLAAKDDRAPDPDPTRPRCLADTYPQDGKVDFSDLRRIKWDMFRVNCLTNCPAPDAMAVCLGDVDNSGEVNFVDLSILKREFGRKDCPIVPCEGPP